MRIEDPEIRWILAANQLEGVAKLLDATITESTCLNSNGKESKKITIEYDHRDTVKR